MMDQPLMTKLGWWICDRLDHPFPRSAWIFDGAFHRECRWCNRIVSIRHSQPIYESKEKSHD